LTQKFNNLSLGINKCSQKLFKQLARYKRKKVYIRFRISSFKCGYELFDLIKEWGEAYSIFNLFLCLEHWVNFHDKMILQCVQTNPTLNDCWNTIAPNFSRTVRKRFKRVHATKSMNGRRRTTEAPNGTIYYTWTMNQLICARIWAYLYYQQLRHFW